MRIKWIFLILNMNKYSKYISLIKKIRKIGSLTTHQNGDVFFNVSLDRLKILTHLMFNIYNYAFYNHIVM